MRTRAPENAPPPGAPAQQIISAQREQSSEETSDEVRRRLGGTGDYLQRLFGARNALSGGSLQAPIVGRTR